MFVLNSFRDAEFLLNLIEYPTIREQEKKVPLSRDKQNDLVFFLADKLFECVWPFCDFGA